MARKLEPIGSKLLYEDEGVRIWDNRIAPGEQSEPHRHETDYMVVDVDGDRIAANPLPGSPPELKYVETEVRRGQAHFMKRGCVETAINVGKEPYRSILIEFKE